MSSRFFATEPFSYSYLENNSNDLVALVDILGHSDLNTTRIYTKRRLGDLQAGAEESSFSKALSQPKISGRRLPISEETGSLNSESYTVPPLMTWDKKPCHEFKVKKTTIFVVLQTVRFSLSPVQTIPVD